MTPRVATTLLAALIFVATSGAMPARAEFTTVINSPPEGLPNPFNFFLLPSNTQLNLFEGVELSVGWWWPGDEWAPRDNIEVNLEGGTIRGLLTTGLAGIDHTNVVFNIRSGTVEGSIDVINGNEINVFGGKIGQRYWGDIRLTGGSRALVAGGEVSGGLDIDGGSTATISGGKIGESVYARNGSDLTISGGEIGSSRLGGGISIESGSTARMTGGVTESVRFGGGSMGTISGGAVTEYLTAQNSSQIEIRGGQIARLSAAEASRIELVGGDFRLNGVPIAGLTTQGNEVSVNIPDQGVLTGALADGTAVILTQQGYHTDYLPEGTLHLVRASVPTATPGILHAPGATIPNSLRVGQRLELHAGGSAPASFRASIGSTVRIDGGEIGARFRAAGSVIDLVDGRIGELATLTLGSVLNVSGGTVDANLNAGSGSTVNITGGIVDWVFEALAGSKINVAGGAIRPLFTAHEGSHVTISGSGFRINGTPVTGLNASNATRQIDLPPDSTLSGVYPDGRPFAFSGATWDYFATGTLTLKATPVPAVGPGVIRIPVDAAPVGLRTGQLLFLSEGGDLGDDFNADWGSVVNVDGGRVGNYLETTGALVNISGGTIGHGFRALRGTVANVSGGTFEGYVHIDKGSSLNLSGGDLTYILAIGSGAVANVSGGQVAGYVDVYQGATLNVSGGRIGERLTINGGATLHVTGGAIGARASVGGVADVAGGTWGDDLVVDERAQLLITGDDFRIDGVPISGLPDYGVSPPVTIPTGSVFSGTFQDGTPFAFSDLDGEYGDRFGAGVFRIAHDYYAPPTTAPIVDIAGFPAPTGVQGGGHVTVDAQQRLGDNFVAGWGSTLTMTGGAIGANFEAVGAQVLVTGGAVGEGFDAFIGSEVTITSGAIGGLFTAHKGSVVNILGGQISYGFTASAGSVVNVLGGDFDGDRFEAAPHSDLHIFGTDFLVDYEAIPGFGPGQTMTFEEYGFVEGYLSDGNVFSARLGDGHFGALPKLQARLTLTWLATGDFDHDADVDAADLASWRTSYGPAGAAPMTGNDFLAWQRQLGSRPAPVNLPVPEPAAWILTTLALVAFRTPAAPVSISRPGTLWVG